jgi:hypothetical protein
VCLNNQNASPLVESLATYAQEFQVPLLTGLPEYGSESYNTELQVFAPAEISPGDEPDTAT